MSSTSTWGILTDVTKCIGCEKCVAGCKEVNDTGEDRAWPWQEKINALSASRWTTIERLGENRYVRRQCRHCKDPACASACPVGALEKTPEGPVVYTSTKCMGCRYCMMACPFQIPRYDWHEAVPSVRKCTMCFDRIKASIEAGKPEQPGCTGACPTGATIFGKREELLQEAKDRIKAKPGFYYEDHVFGETEAGGTSVLTISDVDIRLPATVPGDALPGRTWGVLKTVPFVFLGMGAAMVGLRWFIGRRNDVMQAEAPAAAEPPVSEEPAEPHAAEETSESPSSNEEKEA
jgi:formate dehydrogenase iron-sulfur subunit